MKIDFIEKVPPGTKADWHGSIYIDTRSFEVHRFTQQWDSLSTIPVIFNNKNTVISNFTLGFDITFRPNSKKEMLMNYVRMNIGYDQAEKRTGQYMRHINTYSDLIFYDYADTPSDLNKIPEQDYTTDYESVKERLYIKRFWENNPVLAETPVEERVRKDFELAGSFGKVFNNHNDTLDLLRDGYLRWNEARKITFDDIPNDTDNNVRPDKFDLNLVTQDSPAFRQKVGGLYSELFFSWNCYNDTFYHYIFPLLDVKATWAADSIRTTESKMYYRTEFCYQLYFDLLEAHKRKFRSRLSEITDICSNKKMIRQLYDEASKDFYNESLAMLQDIWGTGRKSYSWNNKVEEMLEKYKGF